MRDRTQVREVWLTIYLLDNLKEKIKERPQYHRMMEGRKKVVDDNDVEIYNNSSVIRIRNFSSVIQ